MTAKKNAPEIEPIIFIDTNIFLDFYRARKTDTSLKYLEKIEKITDKLIITNQIEMEYKKNRQQVILETINKSFTGIDSSAAPALISEMKAVEMIAKLKKEAKKQEKNITKKIEKILTNPTNNDKVYQSFQRIFKEANNFKLTSYSEKWSSIKDLANDRFTLGYPPRKKNDTSCGDAINWEWIVECAVTSGKDIIIVTRDSDYGVLYNNQMYLNDWLSNEFKTRISQKRKILITNSLASALKYFKIVVSKELESEEEEVIKELAENIENNDSTECFED